MVGFHASFQFFFAVKDFATYFAFELFLFFVDIQRLEYQELVCLAEAFLGEAPA